MLVFVRLGFCALRIEFVFKFLTFVADISQNHHTRPTSPRLASAHARASSTPSPKPSGAPHSGSNSRRTSPLPDQLGLQPSTPGVGLWNTSWQRSLRTSPPFSQFNFVTPRPGTESPSSDNLSPSIPGTAWIPLQTAQSHAESTKSETSIPAATSASHRSRRAPRDILTAESNAAVESEFRMLAHARHFVAAEADALHKEVILASNRHSCLHVH